MLWYKAWLETRARFLVSLGGMVALSSYYIYNEAQGVGKYAGLDWYYTALHTGHGLIAVMWVAAVMFLIMGGLLREKAVGTSSFTLSLPVSRARLTGVRILFGLSQALALAVIPWGAMFLVSIVTGKATSIHQAIFHVVLLAAGGLVFFGVALLVSSLVEGEYTAPAVSFGILFADVIALGDRPLRAFSAWNFMVGSEYFNRRTELLTGSIPWIHVTVNIVLATLLSAIAIRVTDRREF
jgi:ABC-2 type transport system permease protein